jgi:hypothetical protein
VGVFLARRSVQHLVSLVPDCIVGVMVCVLISSAIDCRLGKPKTIKLVFVAST